MRQSMRMALSAMLVGLLLASPLGAQDKPAAPAQPAEQPAAKAPAAEQPATAAPPAEQPAAPAEAAKAPASVRLTNMRYMHYLVNTSNATYGDACRVVHQLITKTRFVASMQKAQTELRAAGIIPEDWRHKDSEQLLENGVLAYMLCKALKIEGGLTMRTVCKILGLFERYAYRECVEIKLLSTSGQKQLVSGEELVDAFRRARKYQKDGKVE